MVLYLPKSNGLKTAYKNSSSKLYLYIHINRKRERLELHTQNKKGYKASPFISEVCNVTFTEKKKPKM